MSTKSGTWAMTFHFNAPSTTTSGPCDDRVKRDKASVNRTAETLPPPESDPSGAGDLHAADGNAADDIPSSAQVTLLPPSDAESDRPTVNPVAGPAIIPADCVITFADSKEDLLPLMAWQVDLAILCETLRNLMKQYWTIAKKRDPTISNFPIGSDKDANNACHAFIQAAQSVFADVYQGHLSDRDARTRIRTELGGYYSVLHSAIGCSQSIGDETVAAYLAAVKYSFASFADPALP
ncbi:MAG: hypothetical protein WC895_04955 [Candidatus Shapirobacteria bacterium]|jgi:hypothetical protein